MRLVLIILATTSSLIAMASTNPAHAWWDRWGRWHPNGAYPRYYGPPAYYGYRPPPHYYPPPVYIAPPPYYRPPPPVYYPPYY